MPGKVKQMHNFVVRFVKFHLVDTKVFATKCAAANPKFSMALHLGFCDHVFAAKMERKNNEIRNRFHIVHC